MYKLSLAMFVFFIAATSFAGANHDAGSGINWWGIGSEYVDKPALGWTLLTFIVFASSLFYAIKKPLATYLEARSNQIRQAIEEAQRAKMLADQRVREYEKKLQALDGEAAKMRSEFIEQGKKEKASLEAAAKKLADQIGKDAQDMIQAQLTLAFGRLKSEAAILSLELAKQEIKARMNAQIEEQLYEQFANEVATGRLSADV